MQRHILWSCAACAGILGLVAATEPPRSARDQQPTTKPDRSWGTALQWESQLDAAAKKAVRERKLLMVLAVAGYFEDPFFT